MIPEVVAVMQDQPLVADELKIIASEQNGLSPKDRESIRNGALLIDEIMKSYGVILARLHDVDGKRIAAEERLREANKMLAKSNVFPTITATGVVMGWRP